LISNALGVSVCTDSSECCVPSSTCVLIGCTCSKDSDCPPVKSSIFGTKKTVCCSGICQTSCN
jgi:hypothetical protein